MISYDDIEAFKEFAADLDSDFTNMDSPDPPMNCDGFSQPMTDWDYEDGEQP